MLRINFTRTLPTKPGTYLVLWDSGSITVSTVYYEEPHDAYGRHWDGGLRATGASTHFSRWHCQWSDPIEVGETEPAIR